MQVFGTLFAQGGNADVGAAAAGASMVMLLVYLVVIIATVAGM